MNDMPRSVVGKAVRSWGCVHFQKGCVHVRLAWIVDLGYFDFCILSFYLGVSLREVTLDPKADAVQTKLVNRSIIEREVGKRRSLAGTGSTIVRYCATVVYLESQ